MAHRCWAVDEIVQAIARNLVRDEKRASAVALASCSKALEEPTLGEVWRSLSSLLPLVKCFPPEIWEIRGQPVERVLTFKRAPTQAEWVRFQRRYASKVQYLSLFICQDISTALHILQLCSSDCPLLPNLISLSWFDEKHLPFIPLFTSSSLTSIVIFTSCTTIPMLSPIFKRLSILSPGLQEIKIGFHDDNNQLFHDPSMEEASSQLLMNCNHSLRKFRVQLPISASALTHIIQLPSLEGFTLVVNSFQLLNPLPTVVFPSLRELEVWHKGDSTWLKLLAAIENPVLAIITVNCLPSHVDRFMETFQLTMTGCGVHESLKVLKVTSPNTFRITSQIIACTFSFKNLTTLTLVSQQCNDLCQTSDLTDADIDLLTKVMPCLENLILGGWPCHVPSQITFRSLYTISCRCTRLTWFQIHFNPASFVDMMGTERKSWDVALGLSDPKTPPSDLCLVTTITIGRIPFPATSNAACILALGLLRVFPRLEQILGANDGWGLVNDFIAISRRLGY